MAKTRYKKILEPVLVDLMDVDLRVLDWALAALKDARNAKKFTLSDYESETLNLLHNQVLAIMSGEIESEIEE